jgi:hypothetical protein
MTPSGEANPAGSPSSPPFQEPRLPSIFGKRRGDDSQRLAAEMAETWSRAYGDRDGQVRCPRALKLIGLAASELSDRRREAAWALSLAARRELVHMLDESERQALAISVREEAEKVVSPGWRGRAVKRLISDSGGVPSAAALAEALVHVDAGGSNQARGQRVLRRQLAILAVVLLMTTGILVALLVAWLPAPQPQPSPSAPAAPSSPLAGLATDRLLVLAVLFGVVGACISSIQRATSTRTRMLVPRQRATMWASLTRPLIGAAAGLVVWALAAEDVLGDQGLGLLTFAFAAGFSERVILRFIPDAQDNSEKLNAPPSEGTQREGPEGKTPS